MAPSSTQTLLSPAELSYLHQSLSYNPPIRPDNREATQFRPITAELDFLPSTYGSARAQFQDGTAAIVGIKADVEKSIGRRRTTRAAHEEEELGIGNQSVNQTDWVEVNVNIPEARDDDALSVYLGQLILESLQSSGYLMSRCRINSRFHWKLYIDVLLLSPPLSYPLPLLSLTTHLALLSTRLPALVSQGEEDVLCNDDWEASTYIYPKGSPRSSRPPISMLVVVVGDNTIFDPADSEVAVADCILAVTLVRSTVSSRLRVISIRTMDPPARHTMTGPLDVMPSDTDDSISAGRVASVEKLTSEANDPSYGHMEDAWKPPAGGIARSMIARIVEQCSREKGIGHELLDGLEAYMQTLQ